MKTTVIQTLLNFVAQQPHGASFTQMQRFLVNRQLGEGAYEEFVTNRDGKRVRKYRGAHCCMLSKEYNPQNYYAVRGREQYLIKDGNRYFVGGLSK